MRVAWVPMFMNASSAVRVGSMEPRRASCARPSATPTAAPRAAFAIRPALAARATAPKERTEVMSNRLAPICRAMLPHPAPAFSRVSRSWRFSRAILARWRNPDSLRTRSKPPLAMSDMTSPNSSSFWRAKVYGLKLGSASEISGAALVTLMTRFIWPMIVFRSHVAVTISQGSGRFSSGSRPSMLIPVGWGCTALRMATARAGLSWGMLVESSGAPVVLSVVMA